MTNINISIRYGRNKGKNCGYYCQEDFTYYKDIIWSKHHFIQPKYRNFEFVSTSIIEDLKKLGCRYFKFRVIGHERLSYWITIEMSKFIEKGHIENFDDKQIATHLSEFIRIYQDQQELKRDLCQINQKD